MSEQPTAITFRREFTREVALGAISCARGCSRVLALLLCTFAPLQVLAGSPGEASRPEGVPAADSARRVPEPCSAAAPPLPDTLRALFARAGGLLDAGLVAAADSVAQSALAIAMAEPGPDSLHLARALDVAVRAGIARRPAEARTHLVSIERALALKESRFGPMHAEVAASLDLVGLVRKKLAPADDRGAEAACRRALAIRERCLGLDDPETARTLIGLARAVSDTPSDSLAEPSLQRAIAILEAKRDDVQLAAAFTLLARRAAFGPNPAAGVEPARRALAINLKRHGAGGRNLILPETDLGYVLLQSGRVDEGLEHLQRARAIAQTVAGPISPAMVTTAWNLGAAHLWRGDAEQAAALQREAIRIRIALNPDAPGLGDSFRLLAMTLMDLGEYTAARETLELAVRLNVSALGDSSETTAIARAMLAELLRGPLGNAEEATPIMERASRDYWAARGPGERGPAQELFDLQMSAGLAQCYLSLGDSVRARPHVERLSAMQSRHSESTELNRFDGQLELVGMLRDMGRFDAARDRLAAAIRVFAGAYPPAQPRLVAATRDLADLECRAGRLDEAARLLTVARAKQQQVLRDDHPEVARTALALARVQALRGERDSALAAALQAEHVGREHARLVMQALSERRALAFVGTRAQALPLLVRLAVDARQGPVTRPAWDAAVQSRSLVLDELAERHRHAAATGDCMSEYVQASADLARLVVAGAGERLSLEGYREMLDQARRKSDEAAERLARSCSVFRAGFERRRIGLDAVASALPAGEALISYLRVPAESLVARRGLVQGRLAARAESPDLYVAFVLGGSGGEPRLVDLGPASRVDSLVRAWRWEVGRPPGDRDAERRCRDAGLRLREAVWDPVATCCPEARRRFVVPDGALHLVNFGALPDGAGSYLVEAGTGIHLLSTERDLVPRSETPIGRGLLAMGAPEFDATASTAAPLVAAGPEPAANDGALAAAYRGPRTHCAGFRTLRFDSLPGTTLEIEDVTAVWRGARDAAARVDRLTGAAASEDAFKRAAGSHRVVHVATHGFFVRDACTTATAGTRGMGGLLAGRVVQPQPAFTENPLLLSGLALAGANRRDEAGPDEEDGILTAEEIAALDLSGVEWAVLSACETGVGEVRTGEGVFGLRRAFQVAGARTLVMSLWSVEDEATRAWMRALYEARLERHLDTAESVRAASLEVLRERRAKGLSTHPFWWGAFVAAGDWR